MFSKIILAGPSENIFDKYDVGRQIGQPGQFGCAHVIINKETGQKLAVKKISKAKFQRDRNFHYRQLRDEIKIMEEMEPHPNIIQIHEKFEDKNNLWLVLDYCGGGELFDRIKNQPTASYAEKDAAGVLKQMLEGIAYLHQNKIAHCDLKPDNFLFETPAKDAALKIIDFGMSKLVDRPSTERKYLTSFRGTPYYVAPEVLQGKYLEHCDIWSFGVVMFVTLFGFPPFHGNSDAAIFDQIKKGFQPVVAPGYGAFFPKDIPVSDCARDLISKCLNSNATQRVTAKEALDHAWFKDGASAEPLVITVLSNLKHFTADTQFKREVLSVMTDMMTPEELLDIKATFKAMDKDGNGTISVDEFRHAFQKLKKNVDDESIEEMMKLADVDGDGNLSYSELVLTAVQRKILSKEERLWEAFCKFDRDGDGTITSHEIANVVGTTVEKAVEMIADVDKNKDGVVDYDEFVQMMIKKEEELLSGCLA